MLRISFRALPYLVLLVLLMSVLPCLAAPKAAASFSDLKTQYLKLRNTDPNVQRSDQWIRLADSMLMLAYNSPKADYAPKALYLGAVLSREIFNKHGKDKYFLEAEKALKRLSDHYPSSEDGDDALLLLGDLYSEHGDEDLATKQYLTLRGKYPHSELASVALVRLNPLEEEDDDQQADDDDTVVVIDPGHGGEDLGAVGVGGLFEKDVTLAIAVELEKLLNKSGKFSVFLTRRTDRFVPLAERTRLANEYKADAFVSIHANASVGRKLRGVETYILDNADGSSSKLLAERENSVVQFEGPSADLRYMLSDLIQSGKLGASIELAEKVQSALVRRGQYADAKDLGVKRAPFYVLVGAHMPSILVEVGFIDHSEEGRKLGDRQERSEMARAIFSGLTSFLNASVAR